MNTEIEQLQAKIAALEASRAAMTMVLASLMAKHPNYNAMQLHLTALLEQQLGGGALGKTLTDAQKQNARDLVEWLQTIRPS